MSASLALDAGCVQQGLGPVLMLLGGYFIIMGALQHFGLAPNTSERAFADAAGVLVFGAVFFGAGGWITLRVLRPFGRQPRYKQRASSLVIHRAALDGQRVTLRVEDTALVVVRHESRPAALVLIGIAAIAPLAFGPIGILGTVLSSSASAFSVRAVSDEIRFCDMADAHVVDGFVRIQIRDTSARDRIVEVPSWFRSKLVDAVRAGIEQGRATA